ncbi:hypothetical protein BOTBODRAFT_437342 [Botryobasidium botryosum FD-172 SS1]|uniref:COQ9 C-terminal domain-containing protein n=1 Tax=Botryobasidium botryosum (strain FD-172 SS1) TaxID=930990 RepID=A0A067MXG8_BOTB1|nr:hypothetical protein BOTBODRAFT_437342 [Botryobasidium botryosum FD-172 SS1]
MVPASRINDAQHETTRLLFFAYTYIIARRNTFNPPGPKLAPFFKHRTLPMSARALTLLRSALPLIPAHGFTRTTISLAATKPPTSSKDTSTTSGSVGFNARAHDAPLSDTAISALFGEGDEARRALIRAWLDEGRRVMSTTSSDRGAGVGVPGLKEVLTRRLLYNVPVLPHLKDAFALMSVPSSGSLPLTHAAHVADEACRVCKTDVNRAESWYTRRASIAAIYAAAELHQFASPETAIDFLDRALHASSQVASLFENTAVYSDSIYRSWVGILKSRGVL